MKSYRVLGVKVLKHKRQQTYSFTFTGKLPVNVQIEREGCKGSEKKKKELRSAH